MPEESQPICIVDEDASIRLLIERLLDLIALRGKSFEVAEDFIAYARTHSVSVVVLNISRTQANGPEVQARLRTISPETKVIVMTGCEPVAIEAAALEGGAFGFLAKPFTAEVFLSLVREALNAAD